MQISLHKITYQTFGISFLKILRKKSVRKGKYSDEVFWKS